MLEQGLFDLLAELERLGLPLSIAAWLVVAAAVPAMACALRGRGSGRIWRSGLLVGGIALAANLADYAVTLYRSPDLGLEANPIWRNVIDAWGLQAAKWYGLTGKLLVAVLAGQMYAFYLANRPRLFPREARSLGSFLRGMGDRSATRGERIAALFTLFAFFFAGIQLLYFYIAWLNWIEDFELLERLPSVPAAILLLLLGLGAAFSYLTYRDYRERPAQPKRCASQDSSSPGSKFIRPVPPL